MATLYEQFESYQELHPGSLSAEDFFRKPGVLRNCLYFNKENEASEIALWDDWTKTIKALPESNQKQNLIDFSNHWHPNSDQQENPGNVQKIKVKPVTLLPLISSIARRNPEFAAKIIKKMPSNFNKIDLQYIIKTTSKASPGYVAYVQNVQKKRNAKFDTCSDFGGKGMTISLNLK